MWKVVNFETLSWEKVKKNKLVWKVKKKEKQEWSFTEGKNGRVKVKHKA